MDMTGLSREQLDLMEHWLRQEGNSTLLRHFRQEGIDMIDTAVEFSTYVLKLPISSGIVFNGGSETCVPGLYAAGDEGYGGISGAAVTGWWAADSARAYAADKSLADAGQLRPKAEECLNLAEELCAREDGRTGWKPGWPWRTSPGITAGICAPTPCWKRGWRICAAFMRGRGRR